MRDANGARVMQWFNWILRGGRKETLPDFVIDANWLRSMYKDEDCARQIVHELLEAGPLGESELRGLTGSQIDTYLRELLRAYHGTTEPHQVQSHA